MWNLVAIAKDIRRNVTGRLHRLDISPSMSICAICKEMPK